MVPQKRKRAKGGGRKTIGPTAKSSNFSTRITPETRGALEAEAKIAGLPLSQMAERLLKLGIEVRRERTREAPTSALLDLIGKLTNGCVLASPDGKRFEWNTDPFISNELQVAVSLLLEHLRPKDESTIKKYFSTDEGVHKLYREILENPGTWGKHVFLQLWDDLCSVRPQSPKDSKSMLGPKYDVSDIELESSQYSYDLDRARRALGFREKKS